jgi:Tol biopolymer transport system component
MSERPGNHMPPLTAMWPIPVLLVVVCVTGLLAAQNPADAAFPGANGKIAFVRKNSIYVMNAGGGRVRRLTSGMYPKWSPDGRKIAFSSVPLKSAEIYTINADGSRRRRLTKRPGTDAQPTWSPDGRKIAFASGRANGTAAIYVMKADGSRVKRLPTTALGLGGENPDWSPNGRTIAFQSVTVREILIVNPNGGGRRHLTTGSDPVSRGDVDPDWSPNGRQIAFSSSRDRGIDGFAIWVMNANGSGQKRINTPPGQEFDFAPAWSPDGRKIAFTGGTQEGNKISSSIYTMNPDGTGRASLIQNASNPAWQPVRRR